MDIKNKATTIPWENSLLMETFWRHCPYTLASEQTWKRPNEQYSKAQKFLERFQLAEKPEACSAKCTIKVNRLNSSKHRH